MPGVKNSNTIAPATGRPARTRSRSVILASHRFHPINPDRRAAVQHEGAPRAVGRRCRIGTSRSPDGPGPGVGSTPAGSPREDQAAADDATAAPHIGAWAALFIYMNSRRGIGSRHSSGAAVDATQHAKPLPPFRPPPRSDATDKADFIINATLINSSYSARGLILSH